MTRQRGFKPKSAKNKAAREALDQKSIEALVAAFPGRSGTLPRQVFTSQPETHWSPSVRLSCVVEWHEDCSGRCHWSCCYCTCSCHNEE